MTFISISKILEFKDKNFYSEVQRFINIIFLYDKCHNNWFIKPQNL